MSEATIVDTNSGTPQYAIDVGGVTKQADYVSGSGTNKLVFTYTITSGDTDAAGRYYRWLRMR